MNLSYPVSEHTTTTFVGWLLNKGLSATTISSYLAGVRQKQIALGHNTTTLRTPLINQILNGKKNMEIMENLSENNREKLPVTPKTLILIKKDLKMSKMGKREQLLIWSACTLLFFGAFRGGEILAQREKSFDPATTLLNKDISLKTIMVKEEKIQILQVKLKLEKTNKTGRANIVDVYAANNSTCPVAAWKKLTNTAHSDPNLPAYMADPSTAFTCKRLSKYLADFNKKYFNFPGRSLSTHCFRAGMASTLAKIGYSDEEIKKTGRWSSKAFQEYIRLPRTQRVTMAREIAKLNF